MLSYTPFLLFVYPVFSVKWLALYHPHTVTLKTYCIRSLRLWENCKPFCRINITVRWRLYLHDQWCIKPPWPSTQISNRDLTWGAGVSNINPPPPLPGGLHHIDSRMTTSFAFAVSRVYLWSRNTNVGRGRVERAKRQDPAVSLIYTTFHVKRPTIYGYIKIIGSPLGNSTCRMIGRMKAFLRRFIFWAQCAIWIMSTCYKCVRLHE